MRKLPIDDLHVLNRVAPLGGGDIHHVQKQATAVHVTQKIVTESCAVCRALDQPGNVGGNEAATFAKGDYAEIGGESGKVVARDLRLCRRDARQDRGFADTGKAEQSHVCDHFEFEQQLTLFPCRAALGEAGDLSGGSGKVAVAPATASAAAGDELVCLGHIKEDPARSGVFEQCSGGDEDNGICPIFSVHFAALAVLAVLGNELSLVAEGKQGIAPFIHTEDDVTAATAVAAVWSACGHVLFTVEGHRAVSAVTGFYIYLNVVNKHTICLNSLPCRLFRAE